MPSTPYTLRNEINRTINGNDVFISIKPFQSNLEKSARAVRYALNTVEYYKDNYPYYNHFNGYSVVKEKETMLDNNFSGNEFGK